MKLEMLSSLVGTGDFVEEQKHVFSLEVGMIAEVEDGIALKWIASGIAREAGREEAAAGPTPEIGMLAPPETAVLKRPLARKGRRS